MKARAVIVGLVLFALIVFAQPIVTVTPLAVTPGGVVRISVRGQAGERCGIEVRDPLGDLAYVREITLSPSGEGSVLWQVSIAARIGTYTMFISCDRSGALPAPIALRVSPLVGGEARRDLSPLLLTALAALALGLAAAVIAKKF